MFAFMASWPIWVISAAIAGVMGALAGLIGHVVARGNRKAAIICAIAAMAASRPISDDFIMPLIQNDIANADLPKKVDEFTTMTRIEIDGKAVRYYFGLDESIPLLASADLKSAIGLPACAHWKDQFKAGKYASAQYVYDFKPSGRESFTLTPADCP